jgi:hypothetical protein
MESLTSLEGRYGGRARRGRKTTRNDGMMAFVWWPRACKNRHLWRSIGHSSRGYLGRLLALRMSRAASERLAVGGCGGRYEVQGVESGLASRGV